MVALSKDNVQVFGSINDILVDIFSDAVPKIDLHLRMYFLQRNAGKRPVLIADYSALVMHLRTVSLVGRTYTFKGA